MREEDQYNKELIAGMRRIVQEELIASGLLLNTWRMGKIAEIISSNKVKCFVDGSDVAITISCNPDVVFNVDDEVWIINTSRDGHSKFVLCKRF